MHRVIIHLLCARIGAVVASQSHIASSVTHLTKPDDMMYNTRSQGMFALLFAIDVSRDSNYKCNLWNVAVS